MNGHLVGFPEVAREILRLRRELGALYDACEDLYGKVEIPAGHIFDRFRATAAHVDVLLGTDQQEADEFWEVVEESESGA